MPKKDKAVIADLRNSLYKAQQLSNKFERELEQMTHLNSNARLRVDRLNDHLAIVLSDRAQLITTLTILGRRISAPDAEIDYIPRMRQQTTDERG